MTMLDPIIDDPWLDGARRLVERCRELEYIFDIAESGDSTALRQVADGARDLRRLTEQMLVTFPVEPPVGRRFAPGVNRLRVLVVDDSADMREVLSVALRTAGLEVLTAANGLEALICAHKETPAVIVMDITMPILNGFEAARLLKAAEATRHVPVIAHTAVFDLARTTGSNLFAHVVVKPVMPDALISVIRRYARKDH